jgi:hypothetical protein
MGDELAKSRSLRCDMEVVLPNVSIACSIFGKTFRTGGRVLAKGCQISCDRLLYSDIDSHPGPWEPSPDLPDSANEYPRLSAEAKQQSV